MYKNKTICMHHKNIFIFQFINQNVRSSCIFDDWCISTTELVKKKALIDLISQIEKYLSQKVNNMQ